MLPSTARLWRGGATGPNGSLWCAPPLMPSTGFMQAYVGGALAPLYEMNFLWVYISVPPSAVDLACWLSPPTVQGAVAAGLWAATGPQSRRRSAAGSLLLALVGGTFTGAYLMWEFFPNQPLLQVGSLAYTACQCCLGKE